MRVFLYILSVLTDNWLSFSTLYLDLFDAMGANISSAGYHHTLEQRNKPLMTIKDSTSDLVFQDYFCNKWFPQERHFADMSKLDVLIITERVE